MRRKLPEHGFVGRSWLTAHLDKAGIGPQTVAPQAPRQPPAASVAKAKISSREHLGVSLAGAKAMPRAGVEAGCVKPFAAVAWMLKP